MKKKILWLILSTLMVSALLLASCVPAVTEEEEVAPAEKEEKVVTEEEVAPTLEGPQYGGALTCVLGVPFYGFDEAYTIPPLCTPLHLTYEDLYTGNWAKGPAGTGEVTLRIPNYVPSVEIPCLAESWEMPDEGTVIFHIRKGVHFHDKPPVNGREMTADDVVFTIEHLALSHLPLSWQTLDPTTNIQSAEATDRYTVIVKCPPQFIWRRMLDLTEVMRILPREAGGEYPGDFRDWHTCIGTGPFMIVDEVPSSSLTFVRNPNYWMKDPVHSKNTLPYVDRINYLIIPDKSTQLAALRTGKIAQLGGVSWEDKASLLKTNPELKWVGELTMGSEIVGMRLDTKPFDDIRVRQAIAMGIDLQAIAEDYYGGNAEIFTFPIPPTVEFKDIFCPLDEFSESIQELYEYNPEKARQLLAEAGYPNGFKAEIICTEEEADLLSIFKNYWADIGVDLEIQVRDRATYQGIHAGHRHKEMIIGRGGGGTTPFREFLPGLDVNTSMVNDPYIMDIYSNKLVKDVFDWDTYCRVMKEDFIPYILEQCWYIAPPRPMEYTFWQPWLKGYHGEYSVGHLNMDQWMAYVWIDQKLKKEMGH